MQPSTTTNTAKVDSALVNLRARGLDIYARLDELRDAACMLRDGVGQGRSATWPHFMDKYDTISKLYTQLTDELDRALTDAGLQSFVALPKNHTEDPTQLPDLLRTKLDQDIEREFQELEKSGLEMRRAGKGFGSAQARVAAFNDLVDSALDEFQELRDSMATPRPSEIPRPQTPPSAAIPLAAITNGTGLRDER